MTKFIKNIISDEKGQGMTEYGLILGVIGIGAIAAIVALRDQIADLLEAIKTKLFEKTPV